MYIGIDGGGTKTKSMLMDEAKNIITSYESGPSSIRTVPFETSLKHICESIEPLLKSANQEIRGLFAGLGDVAGPADGQDVIHALKERLPQLKNIEMAVKNDVYNAHAGALDGEEGIALIIGTGSVAFGVDQYHRAHRAGGYSYKEGDLGSAYGLGSQALSLLGKIFDGRKKGSPLSDALFKHFKIDTFADMVAMYDDTYTKRTEVAKLAPLITKFADQNDPNALRIIDVATDELMMMVQAVDETLDFSQKQIAIIGSLGQADTLYRKMFEKKLKAYDQNYTVFNAKNDPAFGACILAQQLISSKEAK